MESSKNLIACDACGSLRQGCPCSTAPTGRQHHPGQPQQQQKQEQEVDVSSNGGKDKNDTTTPSHNALPMSTTISPHYDDKKDVVLWLEFLSDAQMKVKVHEMSEMPAQLRTGACASAPLPQALIIPYACMVPSHTTGHHSVCVEQHPHRYWPAHHGPRFQD
jgi:hypothetical protein